MHTDRTVTSIGRFGLDGFCPAKNRMPSGFRWCTCQLMPEPLPLRRFEAVVDRVERFGRPPSDRTLRCGPLFPLLHSRSLKSDLLGELLLCHAQSNLAQRSDFFSRPRADDQYPPLARALQRSVREAYDLEASCVPGITCSARTSWKSPAAGSMRCLDRLPGGGRIPRPSKLTKRSNTDGTYIFWGHAPVSLSLLPARV